MQRIRARWVVLPDEVVADAVVVINGDRIEGIEDRGRADREFDGWIVPGFVDTHVHGGGGVALGTPESQTAIDCHRRHGTTTMFASLATNTMEVMEERLEFLSGLVATEDIAGIHLEGPFIAPGRRGAHKADLLRDPDLDCLERLSQAAGGTLTVATIAPELDGGLEAIEWLVDRGVRGAIGHTDADADVAREAVDAGASVATHLFNGMRPIHHRNPGPTPALMNDPRVLIELICDGYHVAPDVIQMAIDAAGLERVAFVTDAIAATDAGDGRFPVGALEAEVRDGRAWVVEGQGSHHTIAGSILTMDQVFHNAVHLVGLSMAEAARLTSTNAARWYGLGAVGAIEPGKRADLCVMRGDATLQAVMRRGHWL